MIILAETWLVPNIADNEFIDGRYIVYRCDRDRESCEKADGGGVLVAVRRGIHVTRCWLSDTSRDSISLPKNIEYVCLSLQSNLSNKEHIICGTYLPPNLNYATYTSFINVLQSKVSKSKVDQFYIIGDFNLSGLDWHEVSPFVYIISPESCNTSLYKHFSNFLSAINGKQHNGLVNSKGRILDLCISNAEICTCEQLSYNLGPHRLLASTSFNTN